jgi:DNA polymerase-3 subunit alpha
VIPVHNHSHYSALDGYSTPEEIALAVSGMGGAFLTDHGTVAGFPEFADAMAKAGLFAGFGMEAYQSRWGRRVRRHPDEDRPLKGNEDSFHLVLLAVSPEGYRNLMRLSDAGHREGFYYYPRLDWDLLEKYREGIVATTACMGSLVNQRLMEDDLSPLDRMVEIYGDDLLVEIHTYESELQRELNRALVEVADERGLRLVYANDAHYAFKEQYDAHELMLCAQMAEKRDHVKGRKVGKEVEPFQPDDPTRHHPQCLYIMSEDDVREHLSYLDDAVVDEAIATSDWLAERAVEGWGGQKPRPLKAPESEALPRWPGGDPEDELERLIGEGLVRLYGGGDPAAVPREVLDAAERELDQIAEAGMSDYFLVVRDYIEWAKAEGILVGPGRGSVGGSVLAYALGISLVDPVRYGLSFSRFWNAHRRGLPDIDTDFEQAHRRALVDMVREKYGEEHVLLVGNHIKLQPKAAIQKAAAVVLDPVPYKEINEITKAIEKTDYVRAGQRLDWEGLFETDPDVFGGFASVVKETREEVLSKLERYDGLFEAAEMLQGRLSTYGVHPSAVVISPAHLPSYLPARSAKGDGPERELITQAEFRQVEEAGFAKFDFLGVKTLDVLKRAAVLTGMTAREAVDFFWALDLDQLGEEHYRPLWEGHTLGLFQVDEHQNPRRYGKEIRPESIEDLAAIVALNNPGPIRSGAADEYIARRKNPKKVVYRYAQALLEPILAETYGVLVYQEQVMDIFRALGEGEEEADNIRRILSKRDFKKMEREVQPRFMEACERRGLSAAEATRLYEDIKEFSLYGFNKAHAVAYAMVLAWTLYAKAEWPTEFIMAGIEHSDSKKLPSYVREAARLGVAVLPPDVNRSKAVITKAGDGEILYGLRDIKGVGAASAKWVEGNAPFASPEDMLAKIKATEKPPCNLGHFKTLVRAGALDSFGYRLGECGQCGGGGRWKPDREKRKYEDCPECEGTGFAREEIPSERERAAAEEELLGIALTDPSSGLVEKHSERLSKLPGLDEVEGWDDEQIKVAGVIRDVKRFRTRRNDYDGGNKLMARIDIELAGQAIDFVAFPSQYEEFDFVLKKGTLAEFTLALDKKGRNLRKAVKLT